MKKNCFQSCFSPGENWKTLFKRKSHNRIRLRIPEVLTTKAHAQNLNEKILNPFVSIYFNVLLEKGFIYDKDAQR